VEISQETLWPRPIKFTAIICQNIVVDNAEEKANKCNSFFANICQVDETNIQETPDAILSLNSLDNVEISDQT
jgi:hypothetical protein